VRSSVYTQKYDLKTVRSSAVELTCHRTATLVATLQRSLIVSSQLHPQFPLKKILHWARVCFYWAWIFQGWVSRVL